MSPQLSQILARERIAGLERRADMQRLAREVETSGTGARGPTRIARLVVRLTAAATGAVPARAESTAAPPR